MSNNLWSVHGENEWWMLWVDNIFVRRHKIQFKKEKNFLLPESTPLSTSLGIYNQFLSGLLAKTRKNLSGSLLSIISFLFGLGFFIASLFFHSSAPKPLPWLYLVSYSCSLATSHYFIFFYVFSHGSPSIWHGFHEIYCLERLSSFSFIFPLLDLLPKRASSSLMPCLDCKVTITIMMSLPPPN